ncbi:MAG: hypothetical protein VKK59_03785 [Vampirovibrionales bacterium]|nr:hypothetical protein [Vampirovibrionales bacterium]
MTSAVASPPKRPHPPELPQPLLAAVFMDMANATKNLQRILTEYVGQSATLTLQPIAVTSTPLQAYRHEAFQTYSFPVDDENTQPAESHLGFFHLGLSATACDELLDQALGSKSDSLPMNRLSAVATLTSGSQFSGFEMVWLNALLYEWVENVFKTWLKPAHTVLHSLGVSEKTNAQPNQDYLYLQWLMHVNAASKNTTDDKIGVLMLACPTPYLLGFYKANFGPDATRYPFPRADEATQQKLHQQLAQCRSDTMRIQIGQSRLMVRELTQLEKGDVVVLENSRIDRLKLYLDESAREHSPRNETSRALTGNIANPSAIISFPIIPPQERRI